MTDRKGELVDGKPARTDRDIDVAGELLREPYGRPAATAGRWSRIHRCFRRGVVREVMEILRGGSDGLAPDHRVTQALQQQEPSFGGSRTSMSN